MSRILEVLWVLVRIGGFWIAVSGFGRFARIGIRRFGYDSPVILLGIISLLVFSVPLSLLGLFNRSVLSLFLLIGVLLQLVYLFGGKRISLNCKYPGFRTVLLLVITSFLVITNTLRASEPHSNPDVLITYAVQPDRWLDAGQILFLDECKFSALPLVGEILAAWPASLSSSGIDQLSLLQVFQMSMLLFSCIAAWRILGRGMNSLLIAIVACMATPMLAGWASLPKIEMTVLYFSTVALCMLYRKYTEKDWRFDPIPFIAMGLALGTKLTSYVLLPSFLLLALAIPVYRKSRKVPVWIALLAITPLAFAARTTVHTGAPFYPYSVSFLAADEEYILVDVPEMNELARENAAPNDLLGNKDPEPSLVNISELISSWALPAILFLLGIASLAMKRKLTGALLPLTAVLIYVLAASVAFNPLGRRLFLAGTLEEEMVLLQRMDIDYIYFQTSDPMPGVLEYRIGLLRSDRLEFVI